MKLGHALVWTIVRRLAISQFGLEWNSLIKPGNKLPDGKQWDLDAVFSSDGAKEVQNLIYSFGFIVLFLCFKGCCKGLIG